MTRIPASHSARNRPPRITEAEFQASVVKLARDLGWGITHAAAKKLAEEAGAWGMAAPAIDGLIFHPRIMYRSEPGWPDLTLVRRRDRRLIFAELKAEDGKLSPRQTEVLDLLRCLEQPTGSSIQVFVWRPSDLPLIHEVLR